MHLNKEIMTKIRQLSEKPSYVFLKDVDNKVWRYIKENLSVINNYFSIIGVKVINLKCDYLNDDIFKIIEDSEIDNTLSIIKTEYLKDLITIYHLLKGNVKSDLRLDPNFIKTNFINDSSYATRVKQSTNSKSETNEVFVDSLLLSLETKNYLQKCGNNNYITTQKVLLFVVFVDIIKSLNPEAWELNEQKISQDRG